MMSAISNWRTSPVREFCLDVGTIDPGKNPDREFAYIDIASIDRVQKQITAPQTVLGADAPSRARQLVWENDVLVSTVRPNLNAVAQVPSLLDRQVASTGFCVLRPDTRKINPRLVYYWVQTPHFVEGLMTRVRGANYPAVRDVDVLDSAFSTSDDIHEQARIVELLDQADALRRQRADADAKLARLLPSLFRHHFGDPLSRSPATPLRKVLTELKNGTTSAQNDDGKGYHVTRIETISDGTFDLRRTRFVELTDEELSQWKLAAGDILFSHINSESHLGKTALIPSLPVPVAHGMNLLLLRPNLTEVTPDFLHALLCTPTVRAFWRTRCRRAVNQASINQNDLSSLSFFLPPLEQQLEFSRHSQQYYTTLACAAASAAKLEALFQTLLHRAFTGELTAKWREAHLREGVQEMSRLSRP